MGSGRWLTGQEIRDVYLAALRQNFIDKDIDCSMEEEQGWRDYSDSSGMTVANLRAKLPEYDLPRQDNLDFFNSLDITWTNINACRIIINNRYQIDADTLKCFSANGAWMLPCVKAVLANGEPHVCIDMVLVDGMQENE